MPANPATSTAKSSSCRKPIQVLVVHTVAATHCRTTAAAQRRSLSSPRLTKTDMLRHRVAVPVSPTPALREDSDARMCRTGGRSDHDRQSAWQLHRGHRCAAHKSGQITWPSQRLPPSHWLGHPSAIARPRTRPPARRKDPSMTTYATTDPPANWRPTAEQQKHRRLAGFMQWMSEHRGIAPADFRQAWRWWVEDVSEFWGAVREYFSVTGTRFNGSAFAVERMPGECSPSPS